MGRTHHTCEVFFLNGRSLFESPTMEGVLNPRPFPCASDKEASTWTWYSETDRKNTNIHADFHGAAPNGETVEIRVRDSCFHPARPGVNHISVGGFRTTQAATQWAPPAADRTGLVGTRRPRDGSSKTT